RTKMYLCHSKELILKDTESLGNNKAPACESRGFVRKRKKGCILTHLLCSSVIFVFFLCHNSTNTSCTTSSASSSPTIRLA
ncbi:MAG: hypothetical protein MSN12_07570, partial [Bacteroides stercoris]|nr:hypothetical protein [Bacteroides stercoris]